MQIFGRTKTYKIRLKNKVFQDNNYITGIRQIIDHTYRPTPYRVRQISLETGFWP